MYPNAKISELVAVLDTIDPASVAAGTVTTGWVSVSQCERLAAIINTGTLGASATVDAKLQQASDSSGTGAKDITGKAITQIVKATGDNKQAVINLRAEELDINNAFSYVRLSITVGTAASVLGANLIGMTVKNYPASVNNNADVVQIV